MDEAATSFDEHRFAGPGDALLSAAHRLADAPEPGDGSLEQALWFEARAQVAASNSYNIVAADLLQRAQDLQIALGRTTDALYLRACAYTARINATRADVATAAAMCRELAALAGTMTDQTPSAVQVEVQLMVAFGWIAVQQFAAAEEVIIKAEKVANGSQYHRARAIGAEALVCGQSGRNEQALAFAGTSRAIASDIGDRLQMATMAQYIAGLYAGAGDLETALAEADSAMDDAQAQSDLFHATTLRLRGTLHVAAGDDRQGLRDLRAALELAARHRDCDLPTAAPIVLTIAQQLLSAEQPNKAAELLTSYAVDLDTLTGDASIEADTLRYVVYVKVGDFGAAAPAIQRLATAYDAAHHPAAAEAYNAAADVWQVLGDEGRADAARARGAQIS